ncbi:hypothetical protein GRI69_09995 [Erythrobacter vulgaris]|uniref:Sulfotransferase domain-containing protein n=1 Tax=Qipengyuania vulgaris TaxID=291985 RepID=A0A844XT64_9SPHN|nr:sulfotransferase [Qipengyuania vulgaris]MXO48589.1 hypothetical protein [Qipengyuania vulgaris]
MSDSAIPNLFIPGTPKAATTSLAAWLAQHPSVHVPSVKEPHFFNDDRSNSRFASNEEAYRSLFPKREHVTYYCDATPGYLFSPNALRAIAQTSPHAKHIITFRDYAETFFSLHQHERFLQTESIADPVRAFAAAPERRRRDRKRPKSYSKSLYYDERLRVGAQLLRALEFVDRDNILFIDFDRVKGNPDKVWEGMCEFLELDPVPIEFIRKNSRKTVPADGVVYRMLRLGISARNALGLGRGTGLARKLRLRFAKPDTEPPAPPPELAEKINRQFEYDRALVEKFAQAGPALVAEGFYTNAGSDIL